MLVDKRWRPERALALLEKARLLQAESDKDLALKDNMGKDQREQPMSYAEYQRYQISLNTLQAAMLLHKPEAAAALREQIEASLPTDSRKSNESRYWRNRALARTAR